MKVTAIRERVRELEEGAEREKGERVIAEDRAVAAEGRVAEMSGQLEELKGQLEDEQGRRRETEVTQGVTGTYRYSTITLDTSRYSTTTLDTSRYSRREAEVTWCVS